MTWAEWKTSVLSFLDVDATRRGIESLRDGYIRGAAADLKHFVQCYRDGQDTYQNGDTVPFDERAAEAAGDYVKSKLALRTERDIALSQTFWQSYTLLRRQLIRLCAEGALSALRADLECFCGDDYSFAVRLYRNGGAINPTGKVVRFTVKRSACDEDADAILNKSTADVSSAISITDAAAGKIAIGLLAADTGLLVPGVCYQYDVAVFDGDVKTTMRHGTFKVRERITRDAVIAAE